MCLGIPGEVVALEEEHGLRFAKVRFGGVLRDVCIEYVPDVVRGEYVVVHVGFAIARIDAVEAERTLRLLEELGQSDEVTTAGSDP